MKNIKRFEKIVSGDGDLQVYNLPCGEYRIIKVTKYEKIFDFIKLIFIGIGVIAFIIILLALHYFYFDGGKELVQQENEKLKICETILKNDRDK